MTGDIDDVANLLSPSPLRKPQKLQSALKNPRLVCEDIGTSLVTDDSELDRS